MVRYLSLKNVDNSLCISFRRAYSLIIMPRVRIELTTLASSEAIWTISSSVLEVGRWRRIIVGAHRLVSTPSRETNPLWLGSVFSLRNSPNSPNYSIRIPAKGPEDSGRRSTTELPRHRISIAKRESRPTFCVPGSYRPSGRFCFSLICLLRNTSF